MNSPEKFHIKGLGLSIEMTGQNAIRSGLMIFVLIVGLAVLLHYT